MNLSKLRLADHISDIAEQIDIAVFYRLYVAGIEVTQAIQYFQSEKHLTDPADRGPDNSIQLVANKPAWVRVYPASIFGASGVTGTLEVQRRKWGFAYHTITTLDPVSNVPVAVPGSSGFDYETNRGSLTSTLNFVIPADEMIGTLRLIARVSNGASSAERSITVAVNLRQTLRLAGVMISYNGPSGTAPNAPNLTIAAPTLANLQTMSARTLTLFPVQSTAAFRTAGTLTLTGPLIDPGPFPTSGCGASWDTLHARVVNARTADGNQPGWIYYGLLPLGVPTGLVGGCGGGGVAVGPMNQPGTLAHEAGHAAGLAHAPAGGAPNPDNAYPAYEPYDTAANRRASIGEFGLDIDNGNISSPRTFRDFMAYGGPSWISLYHYERLLNIEILNPVTVGMDFPWWRDLVWEEYLQWPWIPRPDPPPFDFDWELPMFPPPRQPEDMISLIVRIERGEVVEVAHVSRTLMHTQLEGATATSFVVELLGDEGQVLVDAPLMRFVVRPCGCGDEAGGGEPDHYVAQALLPNVAPGQALIIRDREGVVWERRAPAEPVQVEAFSAKVESKGRLHVRWEVSGEASEFWLRWSVDGETWESLATGLTGKEARLEASQLPGGSVLLQLVAHDGFFSSQSERIEIDLPEREPEVAIMHPREGYTYTAGQPLRLWGSISSLRGRPTSSESAVWLLRDREIGSGLDTWTTLEQGKYRLTLQVKSESGTATSSVSFVVVDPGEEG